MLFYSLCTDLQALKRAATGRCRQAYRPGTQANRRSQVLLYIAFALHFQLRDFPATAQVLVWFGEFLLRGYRAPKSVTNALSAVKTFHLMHGFKVAAFEHFQLHMFKRALPLTCRRTPVRAPPLPFKLLEQLCALSATWGNVGLVFSCLLATTFFAMARLSSMVPPQGTPFDRTRFPTTRDVKISSDRVLLKIKWAKAHQAVEDAFWVPLLAARGSAACPVMNLRRLLALKGEERSHTPLFAIGAGGGDRGTCSFSFTTQRAREWLRNSLQLVGQGEGGFTFHSLRRGACSRAFLRGASLSDLQGLGGWKSSSVSLYVPALAARERAAAALLP